MEIVVLSCTQSHCAVQRLQASFKTSSVSKSEHSSRWCTRVSSSDLNLFTCLVPDTLAYAASPSPLCRRLPSAHRLACRLCTFRTVCVPTACCLRAICMLSVCPHLFTCAVRLPDLAAPCTTLCAAVSSHLCAIAPALSAPA